MESTWTLQSLFDCDSGGMESFRETLHSAGVAVGGAAVGEADYTERPTERTFFCKSRCQIE